MSVLGVQFPSQDVLTRVESSVSVRRPTLDTETGYSIFIPKGVGVGPQTIKDPVECLESL